MTSRHTLTDAAAKRITTAIQTSMGDMKFTYRVYRQVLKDEGYRLSITDDLIRWYMNRDIIKFAGILGDIARVLNRELTAAQEVTTAFTRAIESLNDYNDN